MAQPPVETRVAFADIDVVHEVKELWAIVQTWPGNLYRAHLQSVTSVSSNQWLRLIAIVGGYLLLRPYIVQLFARSQNLEVESEHAGAAAKISANALRGREAPPVIEESESEEESKASGADWGKKARKRQRQVEKKVAEAQEKARLQLEEDEEDRKLEEFLLRNANFEGNPNPHNLTLDD
ncbi:trafficking PGA2 [Phlyctema vagabunda]|uniref:Trafficking PGA2 n=1 Tax=Phlyctema vagabunda TaxID=108571 RepID=A0ABR4PH36_9HELO